jgi:hypothetical protein
VVVVVGLGATVVEVVAVAWGTVVVVVVVVVTSGYRRADAVPCDGDDARRRRNPGIAELDWL